MFEFYEARLKPSRELLHLRWPWPLGTIYCDPRGRETRRTVEPVDECGGVPTFHVVRHGEILGALAGPFTANVTRLSASVHRNG